MTTLLLNLEKAVARLVKAEVALESIRLEPQETEHLAVHQELDNARSMYVYRIRKLREALCPRVVA